MESKDVARVVMLWPADLKAEIQREVGKRGLTAYVLDAVRQQRGLDVIKRDYAPEVAVKADRDDRLTETPVQKVPEPFWVTCKACGTELENGSCWVCG